MISQRKKLPESSFDVQTTATTFKPPIKKTQAFQRQDLFLRQTKRSLYTKPPSSLHTNKVPYRKTSTPPDRRMGNEVSAKGLYGRSGSTPNLLTENKGKSNLVLPGACGSEKSEVAVKVNEDETNKRNESTNGNFRPRFSWLDYKESNYGVSFTVSLKYLPQIIDAGKGATIFFGNRKGDDDCNQGFDHSPIVTQLRKLLDQFPDDVQLLKEAIQNAEEAGAKEVNIMLDLNTYGQEPRLLEHPDLSRFQGPALYIHNDAVFTDDDWRGLRTQSQSVKRDDQLRFGNFGAGFKSLFHVTDLPCILSGDKLAIMDPQQEIFEAGGHSLPMTPNLLIHKSHQVEPYIETFGCQRSTFQFGFYQGTIFRLPLRATPSKLSSKTCSVEKVHELLGLLEREAHLLLIFASSISRISIHERSKGSKCSTLVFRAELAPSCVEEVQRMRSEFRSSIKEQGIMNQVNTTFEVVILTEQQNRRSPVKKSYRYLVNHVSGIVTMKSSQVFVNLINDRDLNFRPWVATAMPLDTTDCTSEVGSSEADLGDILKMPFEYNEDDGRMFSFVPLPVDGSGHTGLPFLVHGTFSLEQNKKLVKWPSLSRFIDFTSDRLIQWNQCLLKELLPVCYAQMISSAINMNAQDKYRVSLRSIYRAYPDLSKVDRKWDAIVPLVYSELFHSAALYCPNSHSWSDIKGCLFINGASAGAMFGDLHPGMEKAIFEVMTCGKLRVAICPHHVMIAVKRFSKPAMVTPAQVSDVLRNIQHTSSLPWEVKMNLLRYFVRHYKVELLNDLELLPLANGGFTSFKMSNNKQNIHLPIYIAPDMETRLALPGLYDDSLEWDIDEDIRKTLMANAVKGLSQLKLIDGNTACKLLPICLPSDWVGNNNQLPITWNPENKDHPPEGWLKALWEFLARNFPRDLSYVDNIPIIPCQSYHTTIANQNEVVTTVTELIPLSPNQIIIVRTSDDLQIDSDLESALRQMGIWIIDELPYWIRNHPLICKGGPIYIPTNQNILRALEKNCALLGGKQRFLEIFSTLNPRQRRAIRGSLAGLSSFEVQKDSIDLIASLPMLESHVETISLDNTVFISAIKARAWVSTKSFLPSLNSLPIVDCSDHDCMSLSKLLGIKLMTTMQVLTQIVFPDIIKGRTFHRNEVLELALHCLENYQQLKGSDKSFRKLFKSVPFLPRGDVLLTVDRFYDPTDEVLQTLFVFEENFPPQSFCEPNILAALGDLGLRKRDDVDALDIKECALVVQQLSIVPDLEEILPNLTIKSNAIFEYLQKNTSKLYEKCNSLNLGEILKGIRFVRSLDRPSHYPSILNWFGGYHGDPSKIQQVFFSPSQMAMKQQALVIGSTMPLIAFNVTSLDILRIMGWNGSLPIEQVVRHLANVIKSYNPNQQALYTDVVISIYHILAQHPNENELLQLIVNHLPLEWAWYGDGFVKPQDLVLSSPSPRVTPRDFHPYIYCLPEELSSFKDFFANFGAAQSPDPVRMLEIIRAKYDMGTSRGAGFRSSEVHSDLNLCISLLEDLVFPDGRPDTDSKTESAEDDDFGRPSISSSVDTRTVSRNGSLSYSECSSPLFFSSVSFFSPHSQPVLSKGVYLPAYEPDNSGSSNRIRFEKADLCVYFEGADLGVGRGYWEDKHKELQQKGLHLVHPLIPLDVCKALGIPSLVEITMNKVAEDVGFSPPAGGSSNFRFNQPQPSTPFTEVIRPLVKPFTENNFCLPIEMIQNADDAGATEIRFLLDERLNLDAKSGLLDEGMGYWQGPALWVYNDAVMTDDDFAEAFTLDGTTKHVRTDRVGRNGRGLCSVYTVTDMPSFVSRNWVVFFDPHFRYLGRSLKEKSKFGLRINLNRYRRQLNSLGGQFKPYEGIFGWSLKNADIHYPATLFRLPLRNRHLASKSDICSKPCEVEDIKEMFRLISKTAENLLLFSQNLVKISVHHLSEKGSLSSDFVELFSITKRPVKIIRELKPEISSDQNNQMSRFLDSDSQKLMQQTSLLKSSTEVLKQIRGSGSYFNPERFSNIPDSSAIIAIEVKISQNAERWLRLKKEQSWKPWLVTSCMEKGEALSAALKQDDLIPCASAAVPLEPLPEHGHYRPIPLYESHENKGGMLFNFFPTPIRTGLPVHISGSFIVSDDHQNLSTDSRKGSVHSTWNEKLMATAVSQAYLKLVCDMAAMSAANSYPFHLLWPDVSESSAECQALIKTFYKELSKATKSIFPTPLMVFSDGNKWCSFESTYYFDCGYVDQKLSDASMLVSRQVMAGSQSGVIIVKLPTRFLRGFDKAGSAKLVSSKTYNKAQFFEKVFFPHIESVSQSSRDLLIIDAIPQARKDPLLATILKNWQCIPVGPSGNRFEKPAKLIDPRSHLYTFYGKNDNCTPYKTFSNDSEIMDSLRYLGMKYQVSDVSWEEIVTKCRTLQSCKDPVLVREIVQATLFVIDEKLALESDKSYTGLRQFQQVLIDLPFLLAKSRPSDFHLPIWSGMSEITSMSSQQKIQLHRASSLFPPECLGLVCCIKPVLDDSILPRDPSNMFNFLKIGINWKEPTITQVADQLDVLTNPEHESKLSNRAFREEIEKLCLSCYAFLQMKCKDSKSQQRVVFEALKGRYFVLCENRFLLPTQISLNFPHNGSPYLFQLPNNYQREFPDLFRVTEVKDYFSVKDFVEALQSLHDARPREKLDRDSYSLAATLMSLLRESMKQTCMQTSEVIDRYGPIYLPDSSNVLRSTSELRIEDVTTQTSTTPSLSQTPSIQTSRKVNSPPAVQHNPVQHNPIQRYQPEQQQRYSSSTFSPPASRRLNDQAARMSRPFGPRTQESLITRLRRVVCGGKSNDRDILKELLRVADDIGATEICFIKDPRTHRTRDEFWQQQQGPSLCVHFNKSMTNSHVENIMTFGHSKRGRGFSKSGDPGKTGLYGVGFDSVYRLTDIPSIMTGNNNSETICIFDPQGRFIGGTSVEEPARQIDGLNSIRQSNPGVLNSYLEDEFSIQDGTTVRLPLRTPDMAAQSELSEEPADVKTLDILFDKFRQEIFDCLLFLESISSVSIFEIEPSTDVLRELYKISIDNKELNADGKSEFFDNVKKAQDQTQKLIDLPNYEVTYPLTISDNHGHWEKWVISHRFGLDASAKVPPSISDAIQAGKLMLRPFGSVAAMLDSSDAESHNRPSKVFTRLPLNAKIELPVHLNSNFCIDDEVGRSIWPEEESGFKTDWNNLLLRSVVAHAYVAVLSQTPPMMGCVKSGAGACVYLGTLDSFGDEIPELEIYARFFPKLSRQMPYCYWRHLMESVYQIIDSKQVAVIPVAKVIATEHPSSSVSSMSMSVTTGTTEVEWYPTRVIGYQKPYFDNLKESYREIEDQLKASQSSLTPTASSFLASSSSQARKRRSRSHFKKHPYEILRWSLLACGFKLSRLPISVYESFLAAGVSVACITPKAVVDFFKSYLKPHATPIVALPMLPCELSQTPFRDEATLKILLEYCSQDIPYFRSNLSGLPLLLCEDGLLKPFSSARDKRVFLSNAHLLLPGSEAMFVHHSLVGSVFKEADVESCDVFWRFDVRSFSNDLPSVLDRAYAVESSIRRDITDRGCPKDVWLRDVWSFLAEEFQRTTENITSQHLSQPQDDGSIVLNLLQPLLNWCLLPVLLRVRTPENSPTTPTFKPISFSTVNYPEEETTTYLVPISLAHAILDYSGNSISGNQIRRCFGRMGIFELDVNFFEETQGSQMFSPVGSSKKVTKTFATSSIHKILSFLRLIVSNPENPKAVLTSVEYVLSRPEGPENVGLNLDESFTILKYFNDSSHSWKHDKAIKNRLLLMPVHPSVDERLVPIDVDQAYIFDANIPYIGMEVWQKKNKTIFIKPCPAFESLYDILGVKNISSAHAYADHIFKSVDALPFESREEHLLHIRDSIVPMLAISEKALFLATMSKTKILPDSRDVRMLRRPLDMYDPRVSIYEAMSKTNSSVVFPAPPYDTPEWLDFFTKNTRLESEPSGDSLVNFAKQIANDSKKLDNSSESHEVLEMQCQSLMKHLFNPKIVSETHILEKLVDVAFIPPARPLTTHLKLIHSSQGRESSKTNPNSWVSFKDCASYKHHDICWSSSHLLPSWADPHEIVRSVELKNEDYEQLEVEEFDEACQISERLCYNPLPSVDAVIEHVQNLCIPHHHLLSTSPSVSKSQSTVVEESGEARVLKTSILQKVYSFLSERMDESTDVQTLSEIQKSLHRLSTISCIVLDGGLKFVSPKQVVINLYDDDQVPPYVCQAPAELGQFKRLLLNLGATNAATPEQYATALDSISQQAGGEKLHPNEMRLAFTAVRGLFESLKRSKYRVDDPLSRVHWLYLPTTSGHMHRSTEMLFNDDESPSLVERLQRGNLGRPFLVDLTECRLNTDDHVDLVSLLPSRLRPMYLSKTVREHIEPKCRESVIYHAVADKLKYQISSRTFSQGIIRLIRHERSRRRYHYRTPVRQTVLDSIEHTMKKVRVHGLDHLVTYLTLEGRRVKNSEAELECFAEKTAEDEDDVTALEIWNIYLNRAACLSEELQASLAEVINKMVGGLLKQSIHYIQPILSCLPHNINKVLDRLNVRTDVSLHMQSPDSSCQPTLPTPGSLVPKEDHHLLKEDFEEFDIGEYIGYEIEDDDSAADGCPTIIYAVILEKIVHEDFESSRSGSTTPSATPSSINFERRRSIGRGRSPHQTSPQRRSGVISCSSEPDHKKFTQEYRINVGDERPPTVATTTDLYKFHRVEGRRKWTRDEEHGSSSAYHSPQRPQPSVSAEDITFVTEDKFSKKTRSNRTENEHDYKRPTPRSSEKTKESLFTKRRMNRSPRNVFTENNLFADGPESPTADSYQSQPDFESPWHRPSSPEQPTNTFDICQYDEEWGPRRTQQPKTPKFGGTGPADGSFAKSQRNDFEPQNEDDVITTEKVMEEVSDALEEAWQLPENQRRKVVKRILLRWHPDKNIGNEEFATIITQHVQAELERLELGLPRPTNFDPSQFDFDPRNPFSGSSSFQQNFANAYKFFFDQMNQRAKEHKQQRERYRENFGQDYSGESQSGFGVNPQPAQAKRFLRQAQEDLRATDNDYDALDPSYEWVCFKAHQAAEKALKAAQYAVDAVTSFSHDLVTLAASLEDMELRRLAQKLQKIIGNSNRLYNPDPIDFQVIPHEEFTKEMACDAVMCAVDILERVKEFVELREAN